VTPALAPTALAAFQAELTAGGIVTRLLERWAGGAVRAEVLVGADVPPSPDTRVRLAAGDAAIGFRRVRLLCGDTLLSEADNWFVPARLTPAMRALLDGGDTPFGRVIVPLSPRRETLSCERLPGDPMLLVRALVLTGEGLPLADVVERYRTAILDRH